MICRAIGAALPGVPGRSRSRPDRVVALLGVALILATAVVLLADAGPRGDAEPERAPAPANAVQIKDFLYGPEAITVAIGTRITFTNEDSAPHTATSGQSPEPDGAFDTGIIEERRSKSVRLTKAGTFTYYCELHPLMKAMVVVR